MTRAERFYRSARALITPALRYSQDIYEVVLDENVREDTEWLDLGCGHQILPPWRQNRERQLARRARTLVGFDYDVDAVRKHQTITRRICGDVSTLPFRGEAFTLVSANMVFEHLKEPEAQMAEVFRVLKPGGTLIFHTPNNYGYGVIAGRLFPDRVKTQFAWWLQGRKAEDVYPTFYRVNSESVISKLAGRVGFKVREIRLVVSTPTFLRIPPIVVVELLLLRLLMTERLRSFRTNIVAVLERPA